MLGVLGIKQKDFEDWFIKWVSRYENGGFEYSPEDSLPKFSNKIEGERNKFLKGYLEGERSTTEVYDYLWNLYEGVLLNKELAKEMALADMIFSIIKPSELLYLMGGLVRNLEDKT